jgi:hypothetical protein
MAEAWLIFTTRALPVFFLFEDYTNPDVYKVCVSSSAGKSSELLQLACSIASKVGLEL